MYTQCARVRTEGWTLGHNYLLKDVTGALGWVLKGKESPTSSRDGSKLHQFVFLELFLTPDECPGILIRKSQGHRVREASGSLRRSPGKTSVQWSVQSRLLLSLLAGSSKRRGTLTKNSPFCLGKAQLLASSQVICLIPLWQKFKRNTCIFAIFLSTTPGHHLRITMLIFWCVPEVPPIH